MADNRLNPDEIRARVLEELSKFNRNVLKLISDNDEDPGTVNTETNTTTGDGSNQEAVTSGRTNRTVEEIVREPPTQGAPPVPDNQHDTLRGRGIDDETEYYTLQGRDIDDSNSQIYRAAIRNDWPSAAAVFTNDEEKLTVKLSPLGDTALHIAVGTNSSHYFVQEILERLTEEQWNIKNNAGETALHVAARVGNVKAAHRLVFKDEKMPDVPNIKHDKPVWFAAWGDDLETLHYLIPRTDWEEDPERNMDDTKFLFVCMRSGHYDVARYLIHKYPELVWYSCTEGTPLATLALQPDAFYSGLSLRFTEYLWFYKLIYSCISADEGSLIYVPQANREGEHPEPEAPPSPRRKWNLASYIWLPISACLGLLCLCLWIFFPSYAYLPALSCALSCALLWIILYLRRSIVGAAKKVRKVKTQHRTVELLLDEIFSLLLKKPDHPFPLPHSDEINVYNHILGPAINNAVRGGIIELIEKCAEEYPGSIWCTGRYYSILGLAIKYRQDKVFNLIYRMSAYKIRLLNHRANRQTALHAAGLLPPYDRLNTVTGPALQLQRELLWFQKVEEFSETSSLSYLDKGKKTPKMLFTEQHKDLLKDAQEWIKATTASSTVVGALIVTITFAAMFTAPGGYVEKKGTPVFLNRKVFLAFAFSDTAALFFSATSVLSFLSTLTCLSQEDFLSAVPWRLTIGFFSLYLSLVGTIIAFGATFVLVLDSKIHWIKTMVITVGIFPIILNSWCQFPLFLELLRGTVWLTFGKGIFGKQKKENDFLVH